MFTVKTALIFTFLGAWNQVLMSYCNCTYSADSKLLPLFTVRTALIFTFLKTSSNISDQLPVCTCTCPVDGKPLAFDYSQNGSDLHHPGGLKPSCNGSLQVRPCTYCTCPADGNHWHTAQMLTSLEAWNWLVVSLCRCLPVPAHARLMQTAGKRRWC